MMDGEEIRRYGEFLDVIEKLGAMPLNKKITVKHLELDNALYQRIHNAMQKSNFKKNDVIDYLCAISLRFVLYLVENINLEYDIEYVTPLYFRIEKDLVKKQEEIDMYNRQKKLIGFIEKNKNFSAVRNLLRLETRDIGYFLKGIETLGKSDILTNRIRKVTLMEIVNDMEKLETEE